MNYDFRKHCIRFFAEESEDAAEFDSRITDMRMRYRTQTVFSQLNVLDTHDVSRFLSMCGERLENYKLAVVFQMTFPGMPSVFYGDELGITGILEKDYRKKMPWGNEGELLSFYKTLVHLRFEHSALRRGDYRTLCAQKGSRLYVFERNDQEEIIRVIIQMGDKTEDVSQWSRGFETICGEDCSSGILSGKSFSILKKL
jgi:glycosidase